MSKSLFYVTMCCVLSMCCAVHSCRETSTFARSLVCLYRVDLMAVSGSGTGTLSHNRPDNYLFVEYLFNLRCHSLRRCKINIMLHYTYTDKARWYTACDEIIISTNTDAYSHKIHRSFEELCLCRRSTTSLLPSDQT